MRGIVSPLDGFGGGGPFGPRKGNGLRITAPTIAFLNADQPYTATGAKTISVADTRAAGGTYGIALTISGGTFSLSGITGLSFSVGDGTNDAAMTFTGSLTNINNALASSIINSISSNTTQTLSITWSHAATSRSINRVTYVISGSLAANTVAPAISGSGYYGNVLTCSDGTWTGYPAPTITKQWQKNGTNISGQTGNTYTSTFADVGATITCEVTGTNAFNAVTVEPSGTLIRDPDGLNITDLTVAWDGLTAADVGYVDGEIIANDWLDFQIDTVTTFDSGDLEETSEQLSSGEISGGAFEVVLPALAEDTWYIRVRVRRGSEVSAWSAYDTYTPAPTSVTWTPSTTNPALINKAYSSNTHTFTSVDFLAGLGVVLIAQYEGATTVTNVTVNGNAATLVVASGAVTHYGSIWKCAVGSAGSYDVVVTVSGVNSMTRLGISCGTLVGANSTETGTATKDFDYNAQPHSTTTSLTVPTNGVGLAVYFATAATGTTWSVGTEDTDKTDGTMVLSTANLTTSGAPTTTTHAGTAMAAAAWGP
jgi:hypothetical protein